MTTLSTDDDKNFSCWFHLMKTLVQCGAAQQIRMTTLRKILF